MRRGAYNKLICQLQELARNLALFLPNKNTCTLEGEFISNNFTARTTRHIKSFLKLDLKTPTVFNSTRLPTRESSPTPFNNVPLNTGYLVYSVIEFYGKLLHFKKFYLTN